MAPVLVSLQCLILTVVLSIIIGRGIAKTIHKVIVMIVCVDLKTRLTTRRITLARFPPLSAESGVEARAHFLNRSW